jgi:hypothetical protein
MGLKPAMLVMTARFPKSVEIFLLPEQVNLACLYSPIPGHRFERRFLPIKDDVLIPKTMENSHFGLQNDLG